MNDQLTPTAKKFLGSTAPVRIIRGPLACGKTVACIQAAKGNWAVVTHSWWSLDNYVLPSWIQWHPDGWYNQTQSTFRDGDLRVFFLTEQDFRFERYAGIELDGVHIDHTVEDAKPYMTWAIRRTRPSNIVCDLNLLQPAGARRMFGAVEFVCPPAFSPDAENRENLPEGYYDRLAEGKSTEWVRRNLGR